MHKSINLPFQEYSFSFAPFMKVRKTLLYSLLFLIAALQCLFIGGIIYEQQQHFYVLPFIILFIFLFASYFHSYIREYHIQYDSWQSGIWIFGGATMVWILRHHLYLDAVLATAITGVLAGLLPLIFRDNKYIAALPAAIYCGAFIAMTNIQKGYVFVLLASCFCFFAYILAKTIMNGIGGKLGTLAFIGVVLAYLLYYIVEWI